MPLLSLCVEVFMGGSTKFRLGEDRGFCQYFSHKHIPQRSTDLCNRILRNPIAACDFPKGTGPPLPLLDLPMVLSLVLVL